MSRNLLVLTAAVLLLFATGCLESGGDALAPEPSPVERDAGSYILHARYDTLRSFPGGGGVFTMHIEPDMEFAGSVRLSVEAPEGLGARWDRMLLDAESRGAELSLHPAPTLATGLYALTVIARHGGVQKEYSLHVDMREWSQSGPGHEMDRRQDFLDWLAVAHPELGDVDALPYFRFCTYPEILIVEHWTFLSAEWEMRVCFHVMIPPHNWSMMLLRRTGAPVPLLAARRESDGRITEFPVTEYPTHFGY
ncbi:MAG: hypothetical protein RRA94_05555 [Bacteroidota bacterium]|nr:hypothetical protein [Bacteroidota bacterium]